MIPGEAVEAMTPDEAIKWVVQQARELAAAKEAKRQARKESLVNPKRK